MQGSSDELWHEIPEGMLGLKRWQLRSSHSSSPPARPLYPASAKPEGKCPGASVALTWTLSMRFLLHVRDSDRAGNHAFPHWSLLKTVSLSSNRNHKPPDNCERHIQEKSEETQLLPSPAMKRQCTLRLLTIAAHFYLKISTAIFIYSGTNAKRKILLTPIKTTI